MPFYHIISHRSCVVSACVYGWVCVYACIFSPSELVHFSNTLNKIQKKLKFEHINSKTSEESPTYSAHLHIQFLFLTISKFSNVPVYLNLIQQRPLMEIHRKESTLDLTWEFHYCKGDQEHGVHALSPSLSLPAQVSPPPHTHTHKITYKSSMNKTTRMELCWGLFPMLFANPILPSRCLK